MLNDPTKIQLLQSNSNSAGPVVRNFVRHSLAQWKQLGLRPRAVRTDQIVPYNICLKHEAFITPVSSGYIEVGGVLGKCISLGCTQRSLPLQQLNCLLERSNNHLPRFHCQCHRFSTFSPICPSKMPPLPLPLCLPNSSPAPPYSSSEAPPASATPSPKHVSNSVAPVSPSPAPTSPKSTPPSPASARPTPPQPTQRTSLAAPTTSPTSPSPRQT